VRELPMFPLGSVLFPHMVLPLHIFEPRYRALMTDVLAGDEEFGVVLINRGHEVGGGDLRTDVGTVARILRAEELEDGRWLTIAIGTTRIRVEDWLPDEPYPRARVAALPDSSDGDPAKVAELMASAEGRLRRVLAMQAELGDGTVASTFDLATDPAIASWQLAVLAPLNPHDAQRVLVATDRRERLAILDDALDAVAASYEFMLHGQD
jgi:uncharacterized protein